MLGIAAAQSVSPNDTNSTATNKPRGLTATEIDFVPDATNSAAQVQGFYAPAKDTDSFFKETKAKAEKGDADAEYALGMCYMNGNGVQQDNAEATRWFEKATDQRRVDEVQMRVRQDNANKKLFAETKIRAEKGDAEAQYNLGGCFANGTGVDKDLVEAMKWYRKAAEQNNVKAEVVMGLNYGIGEAVAKDMVEAVKWWTKASEQNNGNAQYILGICYFNGEGVAKNYVEAYKWELLAAAKGDEKARNAITILENKISQEQITEGQKMAHDFIPQNATASDAPNLGKEFTFSNPTFSGTGFFITDDGYLISNYHVVKDAAKVRLLTGAGLIDATVVKVDAANDLALLKAVGRFAPLPIAASRTVKLGGTVATVGFPDIGLQGFAPKLAKGEIASLAGAADDPRYFQISLPVQPGNSGGALVDARGNVVGIVAAKLDASAALAATGQLPENVNYAVKSSLLLSFLESVPEVDAKLKDPNTKDEAFEDVVKSAQEAAVLVLVY